MNKAFVLLACIMLAAAIRIEDYEVRDPEDCVKTKCKDQLVACDKDVQCGRALEDCNNECADNLQCWTNCLPRKGDQPAVDLFKCVLENCMESSPSDVLKDSPRECMDKNCK